jgi:alpha-ketoglutarate-dependent taurine dioxygenase
MSAVSFTPIKPHIGAVVRIERDRLCEPEVVAAVRAALDDRGVLVFPRLGLSDAEQLAFTDAFGQRLDYTNVSPGSDGDDVYKITFGKESKFPPELVLATWFWHMDGATVDQPLPKATMLSARHLSATGGQTEFANTFAAYAQLPEARKREIEDLEVIHHVRAAMRLVFTEVPEARADRLHQARPMILPLVWTQREGRKSLVLGTHGEQVIGRSYAAGQSLLVRLMEWAAQPDFTYSHEWQEGDFVIWNNHGVMHRVVPYAEGSSRSMHRTSIMGDQRLGRPLEAVAA